VHPVRIEKRRRGGAIGEAEGLSRCPLPGGQDALDPAIGGLEGRVGLSDTLRIARLGPSDEIADDLLHRRHHVVVEKPVEHSDGEGRARILRNRPEAPRMMQRQMLDDDCRLDDRASIIDEHRELPQRPKRRQLRERAGIVRRKQAVAECRTVLIQCDERLLTIGGERVGKESETHFGRSTYPNNSRSSPRTRPLTPPTLRAASKVPAT
jgi:hypothetical protein